MLIIFIESTTLNDIYVYTWWLFVVLHANFVEIRFKRWYQSISKVNWKKKQISYKIEINPY